MKPAYITCIKDEEKLIFYNLIYYYNIGIRDFYIMYNNSNEATKKQVEKFDILKTDARVFYHHDSDIAYRQPDRFKMMSEQAFSNGCDWIIPIDADEIIKIKNYNTIQDYLSCFEPIDFGYINCRWIDYQETEKDDKTDDNIFTRWKYRNPAPRPQSKIIVKWSPGMRYGDGHHILVTKRKKIAETKILYFGHFPNRSYEQIKDKMITIGKAFIPVFGMNSTRPQVKKYRDFLKWGDMVFKDAWKKIQESRKNNFKNFVFDPIDSELFK